MSVIYENCVENGIEVDGYVNYVNGVNIVGFKKVVIVMLE